MKQEKLKSAGILFGAVLVFCGLVGCGKVRGDVPVPTQTRKPTQAETEMTSTPIPEATIILTTAPTDTPAPIIAPEPVSFPVTISETTFPEELLRKKALAADADGDGYLSREEAEKVTKLHLKKLADEEAKDDREGEPLPEYTKEDFSFNFEGIQYFTELSELTVNLLGGELFVKDGTGEEEIFVITKNFSRLYECTKLKKLSLYEVDVEALDCSLLPNLKRLELNFMYNLETLNPGAHQKLSALWISECHTLETLDVSRLEKLKTLDIVRNDGLKKIEFGEANKMLETIQLNDLSGLTEAEFSCLSQLKSLNLMDVALTSLDVSKNVELEQLCAEGLHLDTLDLRSNPKISYLINAGDSFRTILLPEENRLDMVRWTDSVVTEFPIENLNPETLTGIDIQGTAIKELDVSGYLNLEHLYYDEDVTEIIR